MHECLTRSHKYHDVNMILLDEMKIPFYLLNEDNLTFTVQGHTIFHKHTCHYSPKHYPEPESDVVDKQQIPNPLICFSSYLLTKHALNLFKSAHYATT